MAESFYLTGDIEKYGTGFIRIRKWLKDYPELNYQFIDLKDFIRVSLSENINSDSTNQTDNSNEVTDKVTDKVTDNQQKILQIIQENKYVTSNELAQRIGISKRKILGNTLKLKKAGLLQRIGNAKNGYWHVNSK